MFGCVCEGSASKSVVPGAATSASPGNLSEMQILSSHPGATESEMEMIKFEDDVFNGNKYCFKCLAENCRFFTADTVATFK